MGKNVGFKKRNNWEYLTFTKADHNTAIIDEPCLCGGGWLATDGINDVTLTVYNNASAASGHMPLPTQTYDGTIGSLHGVSVGWPGGDCDGLFLEFTCDGTAYLTLLVRKKTDI